MTTLVSNPKTLFITNPIPETPPAAISHGKKKYSSAIAVNATPIAVSYTHLDVYKRQHISSFNS